MNCAGAGAGHRGGNFLCDDSGLADTKKNYLALDACQHIDNAFNIDVAQPGGTTSYGLGLQTQEFEDVSKIVFVVVHLNLVPAAGVEPATFRSGGERSNPLSYAGIFEENKDIIRPCTLAKSPRQLFNDVTGMNKNQELEPKTTAEEADCRNVSEAEIDAALEGSFPASDPLPWTLGTVPCPDPEESEEE